MALTLTLYNVSDNPKKVSKDLGDPVYTFNNNVKPTDPCDLLNPSFIIDYDVGPISANYCIVSAPFSRNYFITDVEMLTGGRKKLICSVDALTSWQSGIKSCVGTFTRSENPRDYHIRDSKFPLTGDMKSKALLFNTIFTADDGPALTPYHNYILTVVGGGT